LSPSGQVHELIAENRFIDDDLYELSDLPEIGRRVTEVERPTWLTLVTLTQLLTPELTDSIAPALAIGVYPIRGISISQPAAEALSYMIKLIWGSSEIIVPIVRQVAFSVDDNGLPCPGKVYTPIQLCLGLLVSVQVLEVSTCSPMEKRVLNAKQSYGSGAPFDTMKLGMRVIAGDYNLSRDAVTEPSDSKRSWPNPRVGKKSLRKLAWIRG
jgi:hypothetical protein